MRVTELEFFGMEFSNKGISISEYKLKALIEAEPPSTPSEVVSFLGLAFFCERFIEKLAIKLEPLRKLTHSKAKWVWSNEQQTTFNLIKKSIKTDALSYFDLRKRTKIVTDASPKGLAAVLSQYSVPTSSSMLPNKKIDNKDEELVTCVSRTLTEVEKRYSQFEKESLAIVWACEKFKLYLIGREFDLYTDSCSSNLRQPLLKSFSTC